MSLSETLPERASCSCAEALFLISGSWGSALTMALVSTFWSRECSGVMPGDSSRVSILGWEPTPRGRFVIQPHRN